MIDWLNRWMGRLIWNGQVSHYLRQNREYLQGESADNGRHLLLFAIFNSLFVELDWSASSVVVDLEQSVNDIGHLCVRRLGQLWRIVGIEIVTGRVEE